MCSEIDTSKLVGIHETRTLVNVFSGQVATPEQTTDMLSFREIGVRAFKQYVETRIIRRSSSVNAPLRRQKLLTMSTMKTKKKRLTPKEQEAKQVIKCLRRRLQWCSTSKSTFDPGEEQYSVLPRALANEDGIPHKSSKSHWTDKLQQRYQSSEFKLISSSLAWVPQTVIIDAMFIIHTRPLRRTSNIAEYGKLLFNQYVLE